MKASDWMVMDEVALDAVLGVKEEVRQDFEHDPATRDAPLSVFAWEEIVEYIDRSVWLAVERLQMGSPVR